MQKFIQKMRTTILIFGFLWMASLAAPAQNRTGALDVTDIAFDKRGERVAVSFRLAAGEKAVRGGSHLVVLPVLSDGTGRLELPAVVVQGRAARGLQQGTSRRAMRHGGADALYVGNGGAVDYRTELAFEPWMRQADLSFEAVCVSCGSNKKSSLGLVAGNVLNLPENAPAFVLSETLYYEPASARCEPSAGDRLSEKYPFIAPLQDFEPAILADSKGSGGVAAAEASKTVAGAPAGIEVTGEEAARYIEQNQEGALIVYFGTGLSSVDGSFMDNEASLKELYAAVNELHRAGDCSLSHVIVAGFASPEGPVKLNDRLAWNRALAVKELLAGHTPVAPERISLYNGSVNWAKLRELVAVSDMPSKARVIGIIDDTPSSTASDQDARLAELMRLEGGAPYRYMLEHLFPLLRNAAYIKVYYENL